MSRDSGKDRMFARPLSEVRAFEFNESVVNVFQDMISRSVPGYGLLLRMIGLYAELFILPGSRIYDLGCSLGEATRAIANQVKDIDCEIIAVDNSVAMIKSCRQQAELQGNIDWRCQDLRQTEITNASMVVLNLALQFLPPEDRTGLLKEIYQGLNPGGILVLSEKIVFEDSVENRRMIQLYQGFKKSMGYSDLEISQKRTALENVLIPDSDQQHLLRLRKIGFDEVYLCFRSFNFVSYLAIKA